MGRMKKVGPTRGFGARYGARVRKKYIRVITEMKKPHKCPRCLTNKVRRVSVGVWECRKCGFTFAGGAYIPETKLGAVAKRTARRAAAALQA
ncbi:50S ribosomal protein L37ae [Candidatus Bathyarchaeota archaeon]|nr:MAG: 50S ribosomal protein L37ae [Candidatus Bathyarchaeota archaeon]